ncbi:hypothetical protein TNCV_2274331 [Trichonephila clavipes]|nr:hypothetical protein TNCV_2274331 [Trichonephila clavipes]
MSKNTAKVFLKTINYRLAQVKELVGSTIMGSESCLIEVKFFVFDEPVHKPTVDNASHELAEGADLQLTPNHILECPTVTTKLLKMGMVPLRDSLRELLYSPDAPRIAEAVIKTFDEI